MPTHVRTLLFGSASLVALAGLGLVLLGILVGHSALTALEGVVLAAWAAALLLIVHAYWRGSPRTRAFLALFVLLTVILCAVTAANVWRLFVHM
jgi:hypothetical protein